MRIANLQINHYKTVEKPIKITHFSNLHILIGPNNSGKTNILDAIEFLFSPDLDPSRFYDESADLDIAVRLRSKDELKINFKNDRRTYLLNNKKTTGQNKQIRQAQERIIRIEPEMSLEKLINQDLKIFKKYYKQTYCEFCQTLRDYFDDIEISEKLFLENIYTDHRDRPLVRMGQGFRRLFILLFYIFHPNYDIILIDEPEMHLHPAILKKLLRVLKDKKFNNQIFLTTHNSVFVQPATVEYVWRVARDKSGSTQIYALCQSDFALNRNRLAQELNSDNTEMFFADKILLVEGVSDRIFMRGLINKFYQGENDIKVIYAGSKSNIDIYINLCRAFNIPYAVMLDQDVLRGIRPELIKNILNKCNKTAYSGQIKILESKNVFILDGDLEKSYPKKYQIKDTKPLNALYAAQMITEADMRSRKMDVIRKLIASL
ncbi:MAG: AAA family ATPase [Patescibacteria group bacterium]